MAALRGIKTLRICLQISRLHCGRLLSTVTNGTDYTHSTSDIQTLFGSPRIQGRPFLPDSDRCEMPEYLREVTSECPFTITRQDIPKSSRGTLVTLANYLRPVIEEKLLAPGAILLRDIGLNTKEDFEAFYNNLKFEDKSYRGGTGTREYLGKNILPATIDPNSFTIEPHNEMSYWPDSPEIFFLFCQQAPKAGCGGETVIVDVRDINANLSEAMKEPFYKYGIRYHRHHPSKQSLCYPSVEQVFYTDDRREMEEVMVERGQSFRWNNDDSLTLWYNLPATRKHPVTGEELWFNPILLNVDYFRYHPSWQEMGHVPDKLMPFHTYYGDGSEIPREVRQTMREVVWKNARGTRLRRGDLLILDNFYFQHGRLGYVGDRQMFISLACR